MTYLQFLGYASITILACLALLSATGLAIMLVKSIVYLWNN